MKKLLFALVAVFGMVVPSGHVLAEVGDVYNVQLGASSTYSRGGAYNPSATSVYWNKGAGVAEADPVILQKSNYGVDGVYYTYWVGGTEGQHAETTAVQAPHTNLFTGYLLTNAETPAWFSFTGLDYGEYDIYVYSQKETGHEGSLSVTANGVSTALSNAGDLTTFTEGATGNYQIIRNVIVGGSGNLSIAMGTSSVINGMQIVHKSPNPEPASMLLLGVGGVLVAARLRRKIGGEESSAVA